MKKALFGAFAIFALLALTACGSPDGDAALETASPDADKEPVAPATQKNMPGMNGVEGSGGAGTQGLEGPAEKPAGM